MSHVKPCLHTLGRQHGATLIFGLVMLLVMTILGLSSAGSSTLQLKMSGNALASSHVFHAAERARIEAQKVAANLAVTRRNTGYYTCNGPAGLRVASALISATEASGCSSSGTVDDLRTFDWANSSTLVASLDPADASEGRYIIEYLGERSIAPNRNVATRDTDAPALAYFFRISIRGTSASGAETYLRSFYMQ